MKKLFVFLLFSCQVCLAQLDPKIEFGEEFNTNEGYTDLLYMPKKIDFFVSPEGDAYLFFARALNIKRETPYIAKFNKNLKFEDQKEIQVLNSPSMLLFHYFSTQHGLYLLGQSKEDGTTSNLGSMMNKNMIFKEPVPLQSFTKTPFVPKMLDYRLSNNEEFLYIINQKLGTICDKKLQHIADVPFINEMDNADFKNILEYAIDNFGNTFTVSTQENKDKKTKKTNSKIQTLVISGPIGKPEIRKKLNTDENSIYNFSLITDKDSNTIMIATYVNHLDVETDKKSLSGLIRGIYYFKWNTKTGELIQQKKLPISDETMSFFGGIPKTIGTNPLHARFIDKIWISSNGMLNLNLTTSLLIPTSRNICNIHIRINQDGEKVVDSAIQSPLIDDLSTVQKCIPMDNQVMYLYSDIEENIGKTHKNTFELGKSTTNYKLSNVYSVACVIDEKGNKHFKKLYNFKEYKGYIDGVGAIDTHNALILLRNNKGNLLKIARLTY